MYLSELDVIGITIALVSLNIEYTYEVWATHGKAKSRQTKKAFMVCADIARGLNERVDNGGSKSNSSKD